MDAPNARIPAMVAKISSEYAIFEIMLLPFAKDAHIIARCAILLEGGICISPVQTEGYTFTFMNRSLRLNQKAHFFLVK